MGGRGKCNGGPELESGVMDQGQNVPGAPLQLAGLVRSGPPNLITTVCAPALMKSCNQERTGRQERPASSGSATCSHWVRRSNPPQRLVAPIQPKKRPMSGIPLDMTISRVGSR